eukprot:56060_1
MGTKQITRVRSVEELIQDPLSKTQKMYVLNEWLSEFNIEGRNGAAESNGAGMVASMKYGAGMVAAERNGAAEIVDPRPYLKGTLKE